MKALMIGNAALARGLYEAGCSVISSYPGTPSTEITEEFAKFNFSAARLFTRNQKLWQLQSCYTQYRTSIRKRF